MYLKALEIQGFKSFADKTRLTFEKDITAIVGPNGSGKSNISDAILWVMGEQRTKALRGSKMEDVIFGGTEKRGALGYAQVSLIIDNSAHIFDSDSSEIMLTRKYYRSGDSEYYINREQVRLKDINNLLMDTGLGRDGYSIIGQGRIAEIVSNKSTDRREVFEEAAGISRFRYRKEEAERKLEKTEENLLRINDKIEELELQVEPLRKQAEIAKRYLVLRDELRTQEISVWMATLEKLHAQSETVKQEYEQTAQSLEQARAELEALYASSGSISERMRQKDVETDEARKRLTDAQAESSQREAEAAVLRANRESSKENRQRLLQDIQQQETRVRELEDSIGQSRERLQSLAAQLKELAQETQSNDNILSGCRMKLSSREAMVKELGEKATQLSVDGRSMDSRIHMLSEMEKDYEGYSKAVKTVMRESQRGNIKGVHGPVANLIKADEECALAIETALGAAAQNIVIDSQEDGRRAIEMLKRSDSGRATFLPVDTIRGTVMRDAPTRDPGFVGVAYELVRFDARYEQIVANLLGRTVVAETLGDAVRISKNNGNRLRIVTLDGQLINAGGSMTGGSASKSAGILSRANELARLEEKEQQLKTRLEDSQTQLTEAARAAAQVEFELSAIQGQL
ncbi:MAG: AAA family ATPase, partial [Candidatus Limivicinus sp.]|nr:AAA family ATPase [Candidatus Limivicinus sp.]